MEDTHKIRNTKIQDIFNTMEYGNNFENTDEASEWLKAVEIMDKSIDIDRVLKQMKNKLWNTLAVQRTTVLNKLAAEIENNGNLFAQIEVLSRGILAKDTKERSVKILSELFAYYSSFAMKYNEENPSWQPEGVTVAVFDDENVLWSLGLALAPALAAGYAIILQTGTKLSVATTLLLQLAKKVGIPDDVIIHIPSDEGDLQQYLNCEDVDIISLFTSSQNEKIKGFNKFNKKILNLSSYNSPMVVFDCADLDSAVDSIVDAAWGYHGMLPWAINTVLVQENIFSKFADKLKTKISTIRVGYGNDKTADISFPGNLQLHNNFMDTLEQAKQQGIEVFHRDTETNSLILILIGSKVKTNNVLKPDRKDHTVTLLAFRTVDEAVNLANNSKQGIGASVWAENIGLVNEVATKLQVSNVWINNHGLTSPYVTLSPIKESGSGYFGGEQGFYEYVNIKRLSKDLATEISQKHNTSVISAISSAKKAQESWCKTSLAEKRKLFHQVAQFIGSTDSIKKTSSKGWEKWVSIAYKVLLNNNTQDHNSRHFGYNVSSVSYPRGVIAIETNTEINDNDHELILAAVYEGNSVILLNRDTDAEGYIQELSKKFPSGVVNVFPYSPENVKATSLHKELKCYIGNDANIVYGMLPIQDSKIFNTTSSCLNDVYRKVTYVQNVWSNIGYSHQYKF